MLPTAKFKNKHVLVGITGCIAAYKSCELIRYLVSHGAEVRVMMTEGAEKFISKLTVETLSGNPVYTEMFPHARFTGTHHIDLADWSDVAIIAPATANIIGKAANGIADDFVSTTILALSCPIVLAPAMNTHMWHNAAVRKNIKKLEAAGKIICFPEEGFLAEGYSGMGRLARLEYLLQDVYKAMHPYPRDLEGTTVLITAGATQEFLDPIRMLTNRSSGRMGIALALEAYARGAAVLLIIGSVNIVIPRHISYIDVISAEDMYKAVRTKFVDVDIFVSAAAVTDYQPESFSEKKIKKGNDQLTLSLKKTPDILKEASKLKKPHQQLVGFAVETDATEENALKKLKAKDLDMIVLNNPLEKGAGFGTETNKVTMLKADQKKELNLMYKLDVACEIFNFLTKGE